MTAKKNSLAQQKSKLENWLEYRSSVLFYSLLAVYILFSLLYFNARLSLAGDDSTYITRAINFWESGKFPSYQGPLYPMFLSLIVGLAGMNILVLKFASMFLMVGVIVLFYRSFKDRISYISLFFTVAILSVNNYFLFFSSQTFSEPLFMVFQGALFVYLFKWIDTDEEKVWMLGKKELVYVFIVAGLSFLMYLTRTIGFGSMLAIVTFFVLTQNYKRAVYVTLGFAILLSLFLVVKSSVWNIPLKQGNQSKQLLNKNPYQDAKGKEDAIGFLNRFKDNSNLYLSKHFMRFIGFKSAELNTIKPIITILLYLLFALSFFWFAKTNKFLYLISIYLAFMLGITFFSLQKIWDQYRLIISFLPFMVLLFTSSLVYLSQQKKFEFVKRVLPFLLVLSLVLVFGRGMKTIDLPTLLKNIKGDKFDGFTPDWISYLQMVEYSEKNLSDESYVACRKPNMARIYGKGKKFYGIYRIPSSDPDELIEQLYSRGVSHVIIGSLRKNPHRYTGQYVNTIQRYISIIVKKYPKAFKLVKKYGTAEPAYLFQIEYDTYMQVRKQ